MIAAANLPAVVRSHEPAGVISDAADILGLVPGTTVLCGIGDGPAASLASGAVGPRRMCLSLGTTSVARFLLNAGDPTAIPKPDVGEFVQVVDDGWYCTGVRAEGGLDLDPVIERWQPTEIRVLGGNADEATAAALVRRTGLPVRRTAAPDGTAGAALLALRPHDWIAAANELPVTAELLPEEVA